MQVKLWRGVLGMVIIVHLGLCLSAHGERGGPPYMGVPSAALPATVSGHQGPSADNTVSDRSSGLAPCPAHDRPMPVPQQHHHAGCHCLAVFGAPIHAGVSPQVSWAVVPALPAAGGGQPGAARAHPPDSPPPAAATDVLCLVCVSRT